MKKIFIIAALLAALCLPVKAQTTTNTVPLATTVGDAVTNVFTFLGGSSNLMPIAFGTVSTDGKKFGGGLALAYKLSEYAAGVMRFDYWDGKLFMPSLSVQLQIPIAIGPKMKLFPLAYSGMATPLSGRDGEDALVGIFGIGAALRITDHFDLIAAYERWTSFDTDQIRIGGLWRF